MKNEFEVILIKLLQWYSQSFKLFQNQFLYKIPKKENFFVQLNKLSNKLLNEICINTLKNFSISIISCV